MSYDPKQSIPTRFRRGAKSTDIVSRNERELLRIVRLNPGISRAELTERMELTQQSVYRLTESLATRGMLKLGVPRPGTGRGQPSPTIMLNARYSFSAGISVNTDMAGVCLLDFAGNVLLTELTGIVNRPMRQVLERAKAVIEGGIKSRNLEPETMFGAGFAITGFLQEGTTYNTPLPLHEWSLIELGPLVSELVGRPTWTGNFANTAAVCESMLGLGKYIPDFVYLSFDFGFGGAIIANGELLRGGHGNAGELSAMFAESESDKRPALEFLLKNLRENGIEVMSVDDVRRTYDPSWPGIDEWIEQVTPALNRVVNAVYAVIDPQAIVYGGQIPKELAKRLVSRTEFVRSPRHGRLMKAPRLLVSELKEDASSVGAAVLPFKEMFF